MANNECIINRSNKGLRYTNHKLPLAMVGLAHCSNSQEVALPLPVMWLNQCCKIYYCLHSHWLCDKIEGAAYLSVSWWLYNKADLIRKTTLHAPGHQIHRPRLRSALNIYSVHLFTEEWKSSNLIHGFNRMIARIIFPSERKSSALYQQRHLQWHISQDDLRKELLYLQLMALASTVKRHNLVFVMGR